MIPTSCYTLWSSLGLCVVDLLMKQAYCQSGQSNINHPCGGYTCTIVTDLSYDWTLQVLWTTWEKVLECIVFFTIPSLALVCVCGCSCVGVCISCMWVISICMRVELCMVLW